MIGPRLRRFVPAALTIVFTIAAVLAAIAVALALTSPALADDDAPGGIGLLVGQTIGGSVELPVFSLDVRMRVTGNILRGTVVETFVNTSGMRLDTTYMLPLPERAAVDHLEIVVGDRRIVGVVKERGEAQAAFDTARANGQKAALVAQHRPNLFTTAVANVNADERIVVTIGFLQEVVLDDGWFEVAFPLTYTPRYTPAWSAATRAVEAFAHAAAGALSGEGDDQGADAGEGPDGGTAGRTPRAPRVPRASVRLEIDAGVPLATVESPSHTLATSTAPDGATVVELAGSPVVCDRDVLVRWRPANERAPSAAVFVEERGGARYAMLTLYPPELPANDDEVSLSTHTVFVIDVSGSMEGPSIDQAREALVAALDRLRPQDTFNLVQFNDTFSTWRERPQPALPAPLDEARAWVRGLAATGGTEILPALLHGIDIARDATGRDGTDAGARAARVILVTDGSVGNEDEVFAAVSGRLGRVRLHIVGIGSAPNRHLMRKLAAFGRGACEFIGSTGEVRARIASLFARLERPVLTDVALAWDGVPPAEVFPERLPDLYAGQPLVVSVRLASGQGPGSVPLRVRLTGTTVRGLFGTEAMLDAAEPGSPEGSGVATRWARAKVDALMDRLAESAAPDDVRREILSVAIPFHLVTPYTSLVAVEEQPTAKGDTSSHAQLPNGVPAGSHLFDNDGSLPCGGTEGPLHVALGMVLLASGALFAWQWWVRR